MPLVKHETQAIYTIGVAAKLLGLSTHTLRLYEREGLILPKRTGTNRRLYSEVEIEKVRDIRRMIVDEGLNIAAIRHLLALIPCWKLRDGYCGECSDDCAALKTVDKPCWSSTEKCLHQLETCRQCSVYVLSTKLIKLKKMLVFNPC